MARIKRPRKNTSRRGGKSRLPKRSRRRGKYSRKVSKRKSYRRNRRTRRQRGGNLGAYNEASNALKKLLRLSDEDSNKDRITILERRLTVSGVAGLGGARARNWIIKNLVTQGDCGVDGVPTNAEFCTKLEKINLSQDAKDYLQSSDFTDDKAVRFLNAASRPY